MRVSRRTTGFRVAVLFVGAIVSVGPASASRAADRSAPPAAFSGLPVMPAGTGSAATDLKATVECSRTELRKGIATLSWTPASPPGTEQRVLVTIYSFQSGRLEWSDPLPSDQGNGVWDRLYGQAFHYWLVLTRHQTGWAASATARFEGPLCVATQPGLSRPAP